MKKEPVYLGPKQPPTTATAGAKRKLSPRIRMTILLILLTLVSLVATLVSIKPQSAAEKREQWMASFTFNGPNYYNGTGMWWFSMSGKMNRKRVDEVVRLIADDLAHKEDKPNCTIVITGLIKMEESP